MLDSTPQSISSVSVDVRVVGGGSVFLFVLFTERAREWVDAFVNEDRVTFGDGIAVEHRYASALATGMQDAGLNLEAWGSWR